jgi:hypothetical protein
VQQVLNYGDERQTGWCVYCGEERESYEHVPPRIFLDRPFPENLSTVESCIRCNGGFSKDEEFVACLIECAKVGSVVDVRRKRIRSIVTRKPSLAARLIKARAILQDQAVAFSPEISRVRNVICKVAKGHALFELNDPQCKEPTWVGFAPLSSLRGNELRHFESTVAGSLWPEVASRALQRMVRSDRNLHVWDWIVVQPGRYRYLVAGERDGVLVRTVIDEYLATEVYWRSAHTRSPPR